MTYVPKVGDLYHFKGDDYDPDEHPYTYEEDVGILVNYNPEIQEGLIYWLRYPDPDQETRLTTFILLDEHVISLRDMQRLLEKTRQCAEESRMIHITGKIPKRVAIARWWY